MEFDEIEAGKKVYKRQREHISTRKYTVDTYFPVYVISIDVEKKEIIASINGMPAQKYYQPDYAKWTKERGENSGVPVLRKEYKKRKFEIK